MPTLRLDADARKGIKAFQDLDKAIEEAGKELDSAAKKADKFDRAARRVEESIDPTKRYNREIKQLGELVDKNKLSYDSAQQKALQLGQRLEQVSSAGRQAFGGRVLSDIQSFATGLLSASGALSAIRAEYTALRAENERITQTQVSAAGARETLKQNIAALPAAQRNAFLATADSLGASTRQPQGIIDSALGAAFSATGSTELATTNVSLATKFSANNPDAIVGVAGALADIQAGTRDKNALRNLGFLITAGASSRVDEFSKIAGTVPGAVAGTVAFDASSEESAGLFGALSKAITDREGRTTRTATIAFYKQLEELLPEESTAGARLARLRSDPELAKQFAGNFSTEAAAIGPLREFITNPNSPIAKEFQNIVGGFGTAADQERLGREALGFVGSGKVATTASTERLFASLGEQRRLAADAPLSQEAEAELVELLFASRIDSIARSRYLERASLFGQYGLDGGITSAEAISALESRATEVERGAPSWEQEGGRPERVATVEMLRQAVDELRQINNNTQATGTKQEGN